MGTATFCGRCPELRTKASFFDPPSRALDGAAPSAKRLLPALQVPGGLENAVGAPEAPQIVLGRPDADRKPGRLTRSERGRLADGRTQHGDSEDIRLQLH